MVLTSCRSHHERCAFVLPAQTMLVILTTTALDEAETEARTPAPTTPPHAPAHDREPLRLHHNGAVGAEYDSSGVPEAYYLRVDGSPVLTNCEWVLASPQ
jgi:hypothetical protein